MYIIVRIMHHALVLYLLCIPEYMTISMICGATYQEKNKNYFFKKIYPRNPNIHMPMKINFTHMSSLISALSKYIYVNACIYIYFSSAVLMLVCLKKIKNYYVFAVPILTGRI